jgi:hypothetical protein
MLGYAARLHDEVLANVRMQVTPGMLAFLVSIETLLTTITANVQQAHTEEQAELDRLFSAIAGCQLTTSGYYASTTELNIYEVASTTHKECRRKQADGASCEAILADATARKVAACDALAGLSADINPQNCAPTGFEQLSREAYLYQMKLMFNEKLSGYQAKEDACTQAEAAETIAKSCDGGDLSAVCNSNQRAMEAAACAYKDAVLNRCDALVKCSADRVSDYSALVTSATANVEHRKREFVLTRSIQCLIDARVNDDSDVLDQAKIDACQTKNYDATAFDLNTQNATATTLAGCPATPVRYPCNSAYLAVEHTYSTKPATVTLLNCTPCVAPTRRRRSHPVTRPIVINPGDPTNTPSAMPTPPITPAPTKPIPNITCDGIVTNKLNGTCSIIIDSGVPVGFRLTHATGCPGLSFAGLGFDDDGDPAGVAAKNMCLLARYGNKGKFTEVPEQTAVDPSTELCDVGHWAAPDTSGNCEYGGFQLRSGDDFCRNYYTRTAPDASACPAPVSGCGKLSDDRDKAVRELDCVYKGTGWLPHVTVTGSCASNLATTLGGDCQFVVDNGITVGFRLTYSTGCPGLTFAGLGFDEDTGEFGAKNMCMLALYGNAGSFYAIPSAATIRKSLLGEQCTTGHWVGPDSSSECQYGNALLHSGKNWCDYAHTITSPSSQCDGAASINPCGKMNDGDMDHPVSELECVFPGAWTYR